MSRIVRGESYNGGKGGMGVYHTIINQIPPQHRFISAFGGRCAITRHKRPAAETWLIEKDLQTLRLWRGDEIPNLKLVHGDALVLLPQLAALDLLAKDGDGGPTFIYLDPPYLKSTRRHPERDYYQHELTEAEHVRLLEIIRGLPCPVAISGYHSPLYAEALKDWRAIHFSTTVRGGGTATEWLWMNYPQPPVLHDDRYLDFGKGWKERDRIKKKINRLMVKWRELPPPERRKLIAAALAEFGEAADGDHLAGDKEG